MTAYAAEGCKKGIPACYETTIKNKLSVDEENGEILDMMLANG